MASQHPTIAFEDVPLDEARRMSRRPRMAPELYHALKESIHTLNTTAARVTVPEGTSLTTMKHRILRVAAALNIPLTIRRVPGDLLFWRSTSEDLKHAKEVSQRVQNARQRRTTRPGRRSRS